MAEHIDPNNGVRVTNAHIYSLLLDVNLRVASVEQTVRDVLGPAVKDHEAELAQLRRDKADAQVIEKHGTRIERMELRVYAILAGIVAAFFGGKVGGIL